MNKKLRKISAMFFAGMMLFSSISTMAASSNGAVDGTAGVNNPTSVVKDLTDSDIIDKDAKGSLTIHKYDTSSAEADGVVFSYDSTDHNSDGQNSTMTKGGNTIDITSTGEQNSAVEDALKDYALKGVEFTYLRVGDVKTLNDINEDGVNGDIELIYGVDTELMAILGLQPYDAGTKGTGLVAVTQIDGINYFTSQQINDALKAALEVGTYTGSYATDEAEGAGTTNNAGERMDSAKGITVKDALEKYITTAGAAHSAGVAMDETNANGVTSKDNLDLGLYLIVETKVPENVTSTTNPWFVQLPMTDIDGQEWFYDVTCYPKNQTGHPTLIGKFVRNAYGTPGLNYNSDGSATFTTGDAIQTGDTYTANSKVVTNGDKLSGSDYAAWLADSDKIGDYQYNDTITASEGDILDYIIVTKLPRVTSSATYLKNYEFLDTLFDGLAYNNDAKIAIYNNEDYAKVNDTTHAIDVWTMDGSSNYNFTCIESTGKTDGSTTIDVTLTDDGFAEINKKYYDGEHYMVLYYTAKLESDATAITGDEGNCNDVTLVWKRTNDGYFNTLEDRSIVYTYGIDLAKTFSDNNTKAADFKAVKFVLYNETEDYYIQASPAATDGLYYVTGKCKSKDDATVFSPSATGKLVVNGIEADSYAMTEIATAKGYSIGQNQIKFTITPTTRTITPASVRYMTVANDADIEHPDADGLLTLSDGNSLTAKEEGTTDKDNMVISALTSASTVLNGDPAEMCAYGAQSVGTEEIDATKNALVAKASDNAEVVISVVNPKGFVLPNTGGNGIMMLVICGVVISLVGVYFVRRKPKNAHCA